MSTDRDYDEWSRYARHLAGEGSAADAERTRHDIAADARLAREADEARSTWHAAAPAVDAAVARRAAREADADAAWARLAQRLEAAPAAAARSAPPTGRRVVAAALAAGVLVAALGPAVRARLARPARAPAAWTTYSTAAGQRSSVYLPDGSRADLRATSTLRVAIAAPNASATSGASGALGTVRAWLGGGARHDAPRLVELAGEAIFTVAHDSARPFRVFAGGAVTEDLGTVFAVRAYADESTVRVVVAEGAVSIARRAEAASAAVPRPAATLAPGDVATLDAAGGVTVTRTDDPGAYLAWSKDRLVFRGERLASVVADLNRAYDARVVVPDAALGERRVTLDAPARTLDATVGTLAALLGLEVRRDGDSTVLSAPPAARRDPR